MAVYTEITDEDLTAFVRAFDLGEVLACKGIAEGIENSNFQLVTEKGAFILTLYEKRVDAADLPFFLGLLAHLARKGVACPEPVADRAGRVLGELSGRPAAIVTFLTGMWPRRVQPFHAKALGGALADMHVAAADFDMTRANALGVDAWRGFLAAMDGRADEAVPGVTKMLHTELDVLEARWPRDLPRGIIHADLFPDNVFFRGEALTGLIDFYFACHDILAYDIAICLNAWCFEPDMSFNITKAKKLLSAYGARRALAPAEIEALPLLARGAAVRFLLTRLYDWLHTPTDALVTPKDPMEYVDILRFHQRVDGPGAYGLD